MTFLQSLILGIVQGLTEFLPISSSAHLVLVPFWLGWQIPADEAFVFDVLVQMGTLLAVIIYYWKDLVQIAIKFVGGIIHKEPFADPDARMGWYLILATIPAGVIGMAIKSKVEATFASPVATACLLLITTALLIGAELFSKQKRNLDSITWRDALIIGFFQAVSIFPGVSRSGSTISGGMFRHFDRKSSARFAFLMSIPVMLGAGAVSVKDMLGIANLSAFLPVMAVGFIVAGIVGYLSIRWLLNFVSKRPLYGFAVYCAAVCVLTLIVAYA
jgi:undecaprenyl-diphosphatase